MDNNKIKLTESQLRNIIKKSVTSILKEANYFPSGSIERDTDSYLSNEPGDPIYHDDVSTAHFGVCCDYLRPGAFGNDPEHDYDTKEYSFDIDIPGAFEDENDGYVHDGGLFYPDAKDVTDFKEEILKRVDPKNDQGWPMCECNIMLDEIEEEADDSGFGEREVTYVFKKHRFMDRVVNPIYLFKE